MPQELEVWYLLPALRKNLSRILIEKHGLKQKQVASLLGVTESAVSQYLKSKRANELKFTKDEMKEIERFSDEIVKGKDVSEEVYRLSLKLRGTKSLCEWHKKHDKSVPHDCKICNGS